MTTKVRVFLVLQQLRRVTASQVKEFLVLCREKYMRAKSEPGKYSLICAYDGNVDDIRLAVQ